MDEPLTHLLNFKNAAKTVLQLEELYPWYMTKVPII